MSRKRDPVLGVLKYFEDAELPLAEQALTLCQQAVRRRQGKRNDTRPRKPTTAAKTTTAAAQVGSSAD